MRAEISLTSVLGLLHPVLVFAQQSDQPPSSSAWDWYDPRHVFGFGWGFWWMMPLMMLFFFLVCAACIWIFFGRRASGAPHHWGPLWHTMNRPGSDPTHSALKILNERFARGDIDKADYEERRATILASRGP